MAGGNVLFYIVLIKQMNKIEIDRIRGHKKKGRKYQYLIHFKGLTYDEDIWYSENFLNKELIRKYWKKAPDQNFYIEEDDSDKDKVLTLLELQYKTPIRIIGAYKKEDVLYYRVEFANPEPINEKEDDDNEKELRENGVFYSVQSEHMKKLYPQTVCNFLERHIIIKKK